jgi:hypothetical protein
MKQTGTSSVKPVIVLFFLAPIVSELLLGSTPMSRIHFLLPATLLYGSGAILIREMVRRSNKGWLNVILLGVVFGILEECVVLQSVFNPDFLGLDITFGRKWGINWAWAEYIVGYHAVWSVALPILLAELIFPESKSLPWLRNSGVILFIVIYVLGCVVHYFIFQDMSHYQAPLFHLAGACVLSVLLIVASWLSLHKRVLPFTVPRSPFTIAVIVFVLSAGWLFFLGMVFTKGSGLPLWLIESGGPSLIALFVVVISRTPQAHWNDVGRFSILIGCLIASMSFGMYVLIQTKNKLDIISHIVFSIVTLVLLAVFFAKRLVKLNE